MKVLWKYWTWNYEGSTKLCLKRIPNAKFIFSITMYFSFKNAHLLPLMLSYLKFLFPLCTEYPRTCILLLFMLSPALRMPLLNHSWLPTSSLIILKTSYPFFPSCGSRDTWAHLCADAVKHIITRCTSINPELFSDTQHLIMPGQNFRGPASITETTATYTAYPIGLRRARFTSPYISLAVEISDFTNPCMSKFQQEQFSFFTSWKEEMIF